MSNVHIAQKAFTDSRYATLGRLIGADRWAALGRMTAVWNLCREKISATLSSEEIDDLFADVKDFSKSVIKSGLARVSLKGIYICGAARMKCEPVAKVALGEDSIAMKAARYMFACLRDNSPSFKEPDFQRWATEINSILAERSAAELRKVIDFATMDTFWQRVILSPRSLRNSRRDGVQNYDKILRAMKPVKNAKAVASAPRKEE